MCGITGIVSLKADVQQQLLKAEKVQLHRGPNAQGIIQKKVDNWTIGLGSQRLSILDLSEAGNQPMAADDGSSWIVYNGEVYNYKEIRIELQQLGHTFKSNSDTEVVLKALIEWGPEKALNKFNGMWGFAWLDAAAKRLVIARDRMGVKPFYYFIKNDYLCLSSELKAILAMTDTRFSLNYKVVGQYLDQYLSETYEETFFMGIQKLPAAHFGVVDLTCDTLQVDLFQYWTIPTERSRYVSEEKLASEIQEIFIDAVKLRLRSDVPIGIALSGGLDSSSIASVTHALLRKDTEIKLFSVVSNDPQFDESPFVDVVAKHLHSNVEKVTLEYQPETFISSLEKSCWHNDRPVSGFSTVAYYLLMKLAKDLGVTVILSGQGGDESLCGYRKYLGFYLQLLMRNKKFLLAGKTLWEFYKEGTQLKDLNIADAKRYLPSLLKPREINIYGPLLQSHIQKIDIGFPLLTTIQERQALDIQRFSVPALVHYEDRMSMAWSREVRLPFLDYRVIEKLVPLPIGIKIHNGWSKYIFRKAMETFLPPEITWRKDKKGFSNPSEEWLKNELRHTVLEYFNDGTSLIYKHGLVDKNNLLLKYKQYCSQKKRTGIISSKDIFNSLSLEIWLRKYAHYIS